MKNKSLLAAAAFTAVTLAPLTQAQEFLTIGTGGVTGVYYPAGGGMCRLINKDNSDHGIRCNVESTGGSVYNLNTLRAGELTLGVAQSDQQHDAYKGQGAFATAGKYEDLRSVFSIYTEAFTVVARKDANIKTFDDLKGKRVNIGEPGSGQRATMEVLMDAKGWETKDFRLTSELKAAEQAQALCDNKIDVMVYFVGHPNGAIKEATTSCETNIVSVDDATVQKLVEDTPYYVSYDVPGGMYRGNEQTVTTLGAKATVVASAKTPDETIYQAVKAVFGNFDTFRRLHPGFADIEKSDMLDGNTAPLHPGAAKYFKETGLL
ncbi:TAXI family TRAP transporter solute-binding subunit [Psychromonas ossibalaenae]|uniref:TAXI family TRAP transporter solute-binding subunit n=1 Tax=Psychromonas ossibalaenae TaxID=444922 RepID=UPI00037F5CE2|nr:TAXI family TRAP transporter solute-binding subunit [Psychromonas ossibalaenae]